MGWTVMASVLVSVALLGCGRPRPTFEYEEPITITHTDAPGAPAGAATSTTVPSRPSPWVRGGTK
jgi:hypothetical protein